MVVAISIKSKGWLIVVYGRIKIMAFDAFGVFVTHYVLLRPGGRHSCETVIGKSGNLLKKENTGLVCA